jgi:hypothetical protein
MTRKSLANYANWQGFYVSNVYKEGKLTYGACLMLYAGTAGLKPLDFALLSRKPR